MIRRSDPQYRAIERWAANLRAERAKLVRQTDENISAAIELLGEAQELGLDAEQVATLLGVTIETLTSWQEDVAERGLERR
jgi:hypothetical protein